MSPNKNETEIRALRSEIKTEITRWYYCLKVDHTVSILRAYSDQTPRSRHVIKVLFRYLCIFDQVRFE
jgi:hypothetical protein